MIVPLTLPAQPSPGAPVFPPALARLGSSELFLLELQGELEVSGDKHGQVVGRLSINDDDGKVRPERGAFFPSLSLKPPYSLPTIHPHHSDSFFLFFDLI